MRSVWVPNGYISPEMKFFPLAVPAIIVSSSAAPNHFNAVTIPNDYGYYNDPEYNSAKFRSALMIKFINHKTYFKYRKRKVPYLDSVRGYYVDEKRIKDVVYPPYIDHGFSGIDEFIEYNANRIYEGTMNLNRFILRDLCPGAFKNHT